MGVQYNNLTNQGRKKTIEGKELKEAFLIKQCLKRCYFYLQLNK